MNKLYVISVEHDKLRFVNEHDAEGKIQVTREWKNAVEVCFLSQAVYA